MEFPDDSVASTHRVLSTNVGLVDNCAHGFVFLWLIQVTNNLRDVAYTEEFMSVLELTLPIVGEVRSENAVRGTFPALVTAGGAGLDGGVRTGGGDGGCGG